MQATDIIQIYDYENAIEAAFKALLEAEEIAAFVSLDELDFQEARPRVEVFCSPGQETGHYHPTLFRADSFTGTVMLRIVSNPKATTREHSDYRATVRDIMAGSRAEFKADRDLVDASALLPYHSILDVVESGTSPNYEGEGGVVESAVTYQIKFNIRPSAWPAGALDDSVAVSTDAGAISMGGATFQ